MTEEIKSILDQDEKILWNDVISRKVLNSYLLFSLTFTFCLSIIFFLQKNVNYTSNNNPATIEGYKIGIVFIIIGILGSFLSFFSNYIKEYVITNKRILIKSGLIGTDFNSIYLNQIKSINLDVGIIGKIFGVGTIKIDTGRTKIINNNNNNHNSVISRIDYDTIPYILNPYEVYKNLQSSLVNRQEMLYSGRADEKNI